MTSFSFPLSTTACSSQLSMILSVPPLDLFLSCHSSIASLLPNMLHEAFCLVMGAGVYTRVSGGRTSSDALLSLS